MLDWGIPFWNFWKYFLPTCLIPHSGDNWRVPIGGKSCDRLEGESTSWSNEGNDIIFEVHVGGKSWRTAAGTDRVTGNKIDGIWNFRLRLFVPVSSHLSQGLIKVLWASRDVSRRIKVPNLLSFYCFERMFLKTNKSADWWSDEYGRSIGRSGDVVFIDKFLWAWTFYEASPVPTASLKQHSPFNQLKGIVTSVLQLRRKRGSDISEPLIAKP